MIDSEFLKRSEHVFERLDTELEALADAAGVDLECTRSGNVLTIELSQDRSQVIVNTQQSMQEIWVAGRSGGFHYRYNEADAVWRDTRSGVELFAALSAVLSEQSGTLIAMDSEP